MSKLQATLAAIVIAANANAAVLSTAPVNWTGEFLYCTIANTSNRPVEYTIDVVTVNGTVEDTASGTIGPHSLAAPGVSGGSGTRTDYCRFTVNTDKGNVRASYCVGDPCKASGDAR